MNRQQFKERLAKGPLLMDGAMGTALHGRGASLDQSFDAVNLTDPALVGEIHRGYVDAGSDLIETNTFGANRFKLAEYGMQGQVCEINQAAVAIARRVHGHVLVLNHQVTSYWPRLYGREGRANGIWHRNGFVSAGGG